MRIYRLVLIALVAGMTYLSAQTSQITIPSDGWQLIGDLNIPVSKRPVPAVLFLNQAGGNRNDYVKLAAILQNKGIASLRIDLRGHGESINKGSFLPGNEKSIPFPREADKDVIAVYKYLQTHAQINKDMIAIVGASYSGEAMAKAARQIGYAPAYVALSPGSFSDESIDAIDKSNKPWLFVIAKEDKYLQSHLQQIQSISKTAELLIIPGKTHATNILTERSDMDHRIGAWLSFQFRNLLRAK